MYVWNNFLTFEQNLWSTLASFSPTDLEPTAAEIVAAYQAQSKRAENLRNAPLLTQQMRDQQLAAKIKKWPNVCVILRVNRSYGLISKKCRQPSEFGLQIRCNWRVHSHPQAR